MQLYKEAGLPDGVINFLPGSGPDISNVVFNDPYFAGLHFTVQLPPLMASGKLL